LAGPGSLLLRSEGATSAPATFCNAAKLPMAIAVFPMKLRRVNVLMIIFSWGLCLCFGFVHVLSCSVTVRKSVRPDPGVHRISAWVARCDDFLRGAVPPLEANLVIVYPKRGKCVGPAGFCVNECIRIVP